MTTPFAISPETVAQVQWTADCVEHVLPLFVAHYPHDPRPRLAVDAIRTWATNPTNETIGAVAAAAFNSAQAAIIAGKEYAWDAYLVAFAAECAARAASLAWTAATAAHQYAADARQKAADATKTEIISQAIEQAWQEARRMKYALIRP